jgi:hypothetical protein
MRDWKLGGVDATDLGSNARHNIAFSVWRDDEVNLEFEFDGDKECEFHSL